MNYKQKKFETKEDKKVIIRFIEEINHVMENCYNFYENLIRSSINNNN